MNNPTFYVNAYEAFIRSLALPNASFSTGCSAGASCSPGIGIGTDVTNLEESPQSWTLLDQHEVARTPQNGQLIGTVASILAPGIVVADNSETTGNGAYASGGEGVIGWAHLESLADGWFAEPPP